jgi:23S rRNA (guanosine2251-2'-O)-methyltransferase
VWLAEGVDDAPILDEISTLAAAAGVSVRRVTRSRLASLARTEAPQGVLAITVPLAETSLEDLAARPAAGPAPFLLVLDGVSDPHNLGALLRSGECAGVTGAVLPRHRAAHVTPTVTKAAAGAIEHLAFAVVAGIPAALTTLAAAGVWTVGLDPAATTSLWGLQVATEPVAIVLGAESRGLSRLTRERCDLLVAIPQRGAIGSLNVAAAGALACFEVARRRSG